MLSIKNFKSGKGRTATGIYRYAAQTGKWHDSSGSVPPSFWYGRAARALGLKGAVQAQPLIAALEGQSVGLTGHARRRYGFDLTFSAPKSVSLVALANGDDGCSLLQAHDAAVCQALDFIEAEAVIARRGKNGVQRIRTGHLLGAVFRHVASREIKGRVDPHLHSHGIVVNATLEKATGRWSALNFDFGHQAERLHAADSLYKQSLSRALQQRGYGIRTTKNGFEIAGITDAQIEHFSSRRIAVDAQLAQWGINRRTSSGRQRNAAFVSTRGKKQQGSSNEQRQSWYVRAFMAGIEFTHLKETPTGRYSVKGPVDDVCVREEQNRVSRSDTAAMQQRECNQTVEVKGVEVEADEYLSELRSR